MNQKIIIVFIRSKDEVNQKIIIVFIRIFIFCIVFYSSIDLGKTHKKVVFLVVGQLRVKGGLTPHTTKQKNTFFSL